jgi:DNA-binding XRE family transcriptional regulator
MNDRLVIPAQIRAGRALLEWSQEQLAKDAEVGLSTVRDIESERRAADTAAVASIRRALWNGGVVFVAGDAEGGPGVRLVGNWPNIIRRPTTMQTFEGMPFTVEWQGKVITVLVSREVLDDLDGHSRSMPEEVYLKTYERHRGKILDATALAIEDPDNFDRYGRLYIRPKDIAAVEAGQWYKVTIEKGEDIRDTEATALINKFASGYIAAEVPKKVEVFHGRSASGGHVYYFSPKAANIAKDLLASFGATACTKAPILSDLRKVKF